MVQQPLRFYSASLSTSNLLSGGGQTGSHVLSSRLVLLQRWSQINEQQIENDVLCQTVASTQLHPAACGWCIIDETGKRLVVVQKQSSQTEQRFLSQVGCLRCSDSDFQLVGPHSCPVSVSCSHLINNSSVMRLAMSKQKILVVKWKQLKKMRLHWQATFP